MSGDFKMDIAHVCNGMGKGDVGGSFGSPMNILAGLESMLSSMKEGDKLLISIDCKEAMEHFS